MRLFISTLFILLNPFISNAQVAPDWYKTFTGKAGNMNTTLHLTKSGENYSGYIWFEQNQWPMSFYYGGKIAKTDSISLEAASGPLSITLTGILDSAQFNGYSILQKNYKGSKKAAFHLGVSNDKTYTPMEYIYTTGSAKLPAKLKNESTCEYNAGTVWPIENNSAAIALKKEINKMLGTKSTSKEPSAWLKEEKNKFIKSWLKDNSKLTPKDASEMGMSLSVQMDNRILVMYENEHTITLANYDFSYTGGAHGNSATSLIDINKHTGKVIQLADVLTPEGIKALPVFLDKIARLQYGITNNKPLDQNNFFVKKIEPSKEFYVTSTGIGFLYPPYALKSFADGEVNLLIPFSALKTYLQPAFRK
ncbi:MAG: DUF4163 domain-containing protein [Bacteroidota bacterium]|nr:DUF4163 domain-containing protein [Bacteroidota bacterium]